MRYNFFVILAAACCLATSAWAQVTPRDINAARNVRGQGTSLDTNTTFTLRMTRAGDSTPINSARLSESVSISAVIRPEEEDIGRPADIIIVDASSASGFTMRNTDGNFVTWNGRVPDLIPHLEGHVLDAETTVEVFSGELGVAGSHRVFVGFLLADNTLYFTPSALRFDITEDVEAPGEPEPEPAPMADPQPSARERAITLFESTISPNIVQGRCIACHVRFGAADAGGAFHIFVRSSDPNHLTTNFNMFEDLHALRGAALILSKVQGGSNHGGFGVLFNGSADFNALADFLALLDEAAGIQAQPLEGNNTGQQPQPGTDEIYPYEY